jgi:hypothetical protein
MNNIVVDVDDFMEKSNGLEILYQIKSANPRIKFNLFTIPGECSPEFIRLIKKLDWIDMIPHGWLHTTSLEAQNWTYEESLEYLDTIKPLNLTKGFKAPGWQISDGTYKALKERGYWVADQVYNNERRPKGLKAYLLDKPHRFHYHIKDVCQNGIHERMQEIINLGNIPGEYKFIKEII